MDLITPAGVFVGRSPAFDVDPRLVSVPRRIARGLLFHHTGRRLPSDYGSRAFTLEQPEYSSEQRRSELIAWLEPVVSASPPRQVGEVFTYLFTTVPEDPIASAWVMLFYGHAIFVALTWREQDLCDLERSVLLKNP